MEISSASAPSFFSNTNIALLIAFRVILGPPLYKKNDVNKVKNGKINNFQGYKKWI